MDGDLGQGCACALIFRANPSLIQVDPELLVVAEHAFTLPGAPERMFLQRGAERLARDAEILTAPPDTLLSQWENAVRQAVRTKVAVEDELHKAGTEWV